MAPPSIVFSTPIVHPNIALDTGEICLDLLKKDGWSGTYTVAECVKAVRLLLGLPEVDSPLNVDVAALIRSGDRVAARALVEFWCREEGFKGR
ncbi:ubiquitin-conjugating enzyme/RWD-like protein [Zalerion maritima]|uniref:Ubiquitin-conjugating enzyme/RWD-like protein n=1 Tax=Zalerion maritima TaxID=339359 RepID=A0AAD5WRJ7_9PEZI|nr:ubiquitin-conjugating enzyme/RWD-like protein [Zalerion maritima]